MTRLCSWTEDLSVAVLNEKILMLLFGESLGISVAPRIGEAFVVLAISAFLWKGLFLIFTEREQSL